MRGPRLAGTASYSGKSSGSMGRMGGATGLGIGWRLTGGKAVTGGGGLFTGGKDPPGSEGGGGGGGRGLIWGMSGDRCGESVSFSDFWNSNGSYCTTGGV